LVQSAAAYRDWILQMSLIGKTSSGLTDNTERHQNFASSSLDNGHQSNSYLEALSKSEVETTSNKKSSFKKFRKFVSKREKPNDEICAEVSINMFQSNENQVHKNVSFDL
jgi:hypothetical protein